MASLPENHIIQASAVRFLIDGDEYDAANVLLSCTLEVSLDSEKDYFGNWREVVNTTLVGPRAAYSVLIVQPGDDDPFNETRTIRDSIYAALQAVLPGSYAITLTARAELIAVDSEWREQLIEIAKGRGIYNQGVSVEQKSLITWYNLRFRSQSERRIADALDKVKVLFLPNCLGRLGVSDRQNREADFLVCHKGRWGILEVDGEPFHPPSRTVHDHERDRLFKAHGIKVIEHYDATKCYNNPEEVVRGFLDILAGS